MKFPEITDLKRAICESIQNDNYGNCNGSSCKGCVLSSDANTTLKLTAKIEEPTILVLKEISE